MSNNVIKFGKTKKAIKRAENAQKANENRVKFGRTKAQKKLETDRAAKAQRELDGHKRDDQP